MEQLKELNDLSQLKYKPFKKLIELNLNEKHKIIKVDKIKSGKYSPQIIVEFEEFKCSLPKRMLSKIDDKMIKEMNQKENLSLIRTGSMIFKEKETPIFHFE